MCFQRPVLLFLFLCMAGGLAAQELRNPVFIELPEGREGPVEATLHWSLFHPLKQKLFKETKVIEVPMNMTFVADWNTVRQIQVLAPGYWSAPLTLGKREGTFHIRLIPTGRVEGTVSLPSGAEAPPEIQAHFEPSTPDENADRTGFAACPVDEDRKFHCEVPAGTLKLQWQAEGFAPRVHGRTEIPEGGVLAVGSVALQPAAS